MPTTPETVQANLEPQLEAQGLPASIAPAVMAAVDGAGYVFEPSAGGDSLSVVEETEGEKISVEGLPRTYLCRVKMGDTWAVWLEFITPAGQVSRMSQGFSTEWPTFVDPE